MRERLRPFLEHLASFLAPGLVLLLLGIQVAFGLRGFGQPSEGPLVVLQVPGILLGWGGVVLLLPLLVWMILDWWGYDLGGFALKGLGSAVLGIAGGALFGLFDGAGGVVGNGLADVLSSTVGPVIGAIVLTIMAIPAAVLALSMRKPAARPAAAGGSAANRRPGAATGDDRPSIWARVKGFFQRERIDVQNRWYPKQRFDAWGNELPMEFDRSRDVGGIRFADEDETASPDAASPAAAPAEDATDEGKAESEAAPTTSPSAAGSPSMADLLEGEERLPTIPELLAGKGSALAARLTEDPSGGVRELSTDAAEDGTVHVGSDGRARAASASHAAGGPVEVAASASGLLPGVRYAEPSAPPEADATGHGAAGPNQRGAGASETPAVDAAAAALSQAVTDAVRGPAPAPVDTHTRMAASVRESVRRSVDALRGSGDGQAPEPKSRYLQKLEASGMFEFARPRGTPEPAAKPGKAAKPKKAAKKKTAKKKAAAKRPAAKKKASPRKKAAAQKKTTSKPKPAASKPAARKSTATKTAPSKTAAAKKAAKKRSQARERAAAEARQRQMMIEGLRIERFDPLFGRAVEAALDRGAASSMLLTRRLGVPFARAEALLARMIDAGVLGTATESGSNPVLLTAEEWASLDE
ncbi:MAG: DNA translocase FtsK [Planctomycetota bacterium]|nr:DNA translocase FtsK [Planctomycetota bacterium]